MENMSDTNTVNDVNDVIQVLIVEPQKRPYVKEIRNDFRAMQDIVGGPIEYVYLSDEVHIYCNEEGKLLGLTGNRRIENGDVLAGTFFICADDGYGGDISLTEEQIAEYTARFQETETFSYREMDSKIFARVMPAYSMEDFLEKMGIVNEDEEDLER
ncbi:DUF3846 domain-containing protein [Dehalobacter sp. 14DCB1]|uniref:DUF3846 domain-containing protein n=1 Tax=Dehalobacter sp. 14DCB1 TaxID=2070227 RepID=UPI001FA9D0CE|nr:DUF3846 domain-containing protein [Dehalobacter sp. 14DCB1]